MRDAHFKNSSDGIRTHDQQVNSLSLYRTELQRTVLSTRIELVTIGTTVHSSTD